MGRQPSSYSRARRAIVSVVVAVAALIAAVPSGRAEAPSGRKGRPAESFAARSERANSGVVTVISGTVSGTFIQIANDLSFVLDDGDALRILPVIGKGADQNLRDILMLRGIDLGIVRSDGLEALRRDAQLGGAAKSLTYIARLFTDEAHLIAGPDITNIRQLAGKTVNFDLQGSGANYTGRLIFELLGIPVVATNYDQLTSYEMLKSGEIAATFQMSGKPIPAVAKLDAANRFHLLEVPFDQKIAELYLPGEFTHEDYPNLVPGGPVKTVTVSSILAAYNWPEKSDRYQKIARFTEAFFSKIAAFQQPARHPKWAEVNLAAEIPGWTRFKAAQQWLDRNRPSEAAGPDAESRASFNRFLDARGRADAAAEDREALFRDFVRWQRRAQGAKDEGRER